MSFPIRNWRNSSLALLALLVFAGQARGASDAPTELIPRAEGADEISVTPLAPVGIGGIGTLKPEEHPFPA
ncbi:MAG TPA: hypothetical protein VKT70_01005, partial [Stellaceae bacterium]|nr:hypothetical protein [Stellaceae bacterium]